MSKVSKGRVLIVDDDADIRDVVTATLELNGFEVRTMKDGIEALDLGDDYDAILLDVRMPVFDGDRLLDYWLMTNPGLLNRVVVMTGYSQHPRQAAVPPAFAVLSKPFHYEQILHVVDACVTQVRRHRERDEKCNQDRP